MLAQAKSPASFAGPLLVRPGKSRRGGAVALMALCLVTAMAMIVTTIVQVSLNTYKLTMRNRLRAEARAVAESEVDYLYYQFMSKIVGGRAASSTPGLLSADGLVDAYGPSDANPVPVTARTPFLVLHSTKGWRVRRSMQFNVSEFGPIPGTSKLGNFTYVTARVEVRPPADSVFSEAVIVRVGRRLMNSNTSVFQYGVFYEGDLEFNPGGNTVVDGDIVANGTIFMGPRSGNTLTLRGKVRAEAFNTFDLVTTSTDINGNVRTTTTATTSRVNPDSYATEAARSVVDAGLADPTWAFTQSQQFSTLEKKENLLGGADANVTAENYPRLFGPNTKTDPTTWLTADKKEAANNVYRALIAPPPSVASTSENPNNARTDSPTIAATRAYNRAGMIITVNTDGTIQINKIENGTSTDVTSTFSAAVTAPENLYDNRESKVVKTATLDVSVLKEKIEANYTNFNGLLYVNLKNSDATTPAAVRVVNGSALPTNSDNTRGFSLATNGGLYVQGSYNNTNYGTSSSPRNLPAMLMADSVTVLSSGYVVKATSTPISERVATPSIAETAAGKTEIVAGLLTGNVASVEGSASGGAQNLVRYIENWGGKEVFFKGSLARLFNSRWFTAPFSVTSTGQVYGPPRVRTFAYDSNLQRNFPPGTPTATEFSLGTYFTW